MIELETAQWRIVIPRPADWMNKNKRRKTHWSVDAQQTASWRTAAAWAAKAAKVPALGPSRVIGQLLMTPRRRSRIDPSNYSLTAAAAVDGLVDAGIWPDDSSDWVTGPDMRLGPPVTDEALVLHIWGQRCCAAADCHHKAGAR